MVKHKESFVRWQSITIGQLGYAVSLILSLAAASLGFALTIVRDNGNTPGCWSKAFMLASCVSLMLSIGIGLWCVTNRLEDFRKTRSIARDREDWQHDGLLTDAIDKKLEARRAESNSIGERTWTLFRWQVGTFAVGVAALIGSFVATYHARIF